MNREYLGQLQSLEPYNSLGMKLALLKRNRHLSRLDHCLSLIQVEFRKLMKHPSFCIQMMCMLGLNQIQFALMEQQQHLFHIFSQMDRKFLVLNRFEHSLVGQQFLFHISSRDINRNCMLGLNQFGHILVGQQSLFRISSRDIDKNCKLGLSQFEHILVEQQSLFRISFHGINMNYMQELTVLLVEPLHGLQLSLRRTCKKYKKELTMIQFMQNHQLA